MFAVFEKVTDGSQIFSFCSAERELRLADSANLRLTKVSPGSNHSMWRRNCTVNAKSISEISEVLIWNKLKSIESNLVTNTQHYMHCLIIMI